VGARIGVRFVQTLTISPAFGLTGLAITDMLSKLSPNPPPLVFIDTLYHFKETLDLKDEVERKYGVPIHVVKPWGFENAAELEDMYGERLWEKDEDTYDLLVKVDDFLVHDCGRAALTGFVHSGRASSTSLPFAECAVRHHRA
jgi:phosphoadenosine phosphosulfate reductase